MLHLILTFILGFLVATGLALAILPALWRRAGAKMRESIETSLPLSREELQAEIDAVNAEHAMAKRRLEVKSENIRKKAAEDFAEIDTLREQVKQYQEESEHREKTLSELERERQELISAISDREAHLDEVSTQLSEAESTLTQRQAELEELSQSYEEVSLTSSSREIELLSRETDVEKLDIKVKTLRAERSAIERAVKEASAEKRNIERALAREQKHADKMQRKVDRMTMRLRARDQKLKLRQKQVSELKRRLREEAKSRNAKSLAEMKKDNEKLKNQVADLKLQISTMLTGSRKGGAAAGNETETDLAAGGANGVDDKALREEIASIAAEVVNMTAKLEGPDSSIDELLSKNTSLLSENKGTPSLADRVQALRQKAQEKSTKRARQSL